MSEPMIVPPTINVVPMNIYKINYMYMPHGAGRVKHGEVRVIAETPQDARTAFHATHATSAGWHAVTGTEAVSLGELF